MRLARARSPIAAADILEFDLDSKPVKPTDQRLFTERFIHGAIYRARPDVKAVVHSHSPTVIPFTVTEEPLKAISHIASFLAKGCPCFEIRDVGLTQGLLVTNNKQGAALAKVLGDGPVALMRGHGNVVVGPSLQHAVFRAVYTEVNARLQTIALGLGGKVRYLSDIEGDNVTNKQPGNIARAWALWKERVKGK